MATPEGRKRRAGDAIMLCREGFGHRTTPGKIAVTRVAALPGGAVAEVVADDAQDSWAHWHADGNWSAWWHLAHQTEDIDLTATPDGALIAVVAFVPDPYLGYLTTGQRPPGDAYKPPVTRTFLRLTAAGLTDAGLE
jgi:hypothetical protein